MFDGERVANEAVLPRAGTRHPSVGAAESRRAPSLRVVCAVGPESTGKTAICRELARRFGVPWLGEYAREYLDGRRYGPEDVAKIAREQMRREAALLAEAAAGVVLDTDLAVIVVWWTERFGAVPSWLEDAFAAQSERLYLLCRPDLPWEPDPLRESPDDLERLYARYRELLSERQLPFVEIGGRCQARFEAAALAARDCLSG